jgi:hypothetical protein
MTLPFVFVALKKFEYTVEIADGDFPKHGGGNVIFERDWFIKKTADLVLDKKGSRKYDSHYWRAPVGAGKTVFLKLMGRELQKRGCDVYLTSGPSIDNYDEDYFLNLAKEAGAKKVVLMVDEVQNNLTSKHWLRVLKDLTPANLLVLGVGVPRVGISPQFDKKHPQIGNLFPMFLTREDLPELCAHFNKITSQHEEVTARVCERLLEVTAGHFFPFVTFAAHLLDPNSKIDLTNISGELSHLSIDYYLASEAFRNSAACALVQERCFDSLAGADLDKAEKMLLNKISTGERADLEKLGFVNNGAFISPLLISVVFSRIVADNVPDKITLDWTEKTPYAQQIICAGLRDMKEEDFMDAHFKLVAVENCVGFRWGHYVKSALCNVFVAPQVRTKYLDHKGPGPKPTIDFLFNGRLNIGIELALNLKADGIRDHLARFDDYYFRYKKTGHVLHFMTEGDDPVIAMKEPYNTDEAKDCVYTFVKKRNALFRGSRLVQSNVVRLLPSPPARSYSTYALGCLRRVVKGLK